MHQSYDAVGEAVTAVSGEQSHSAFALHKNSAFEIHATISSETVDFRIWAVVQWLRSVRVHPLECVDLRNQTTGKETA